MRAFMRGLCFGLTLVMTGAMPVRAAESNVVAGRVYAGHPYDEREIGTGAGLERGFMHGVVVPKPPPPPMPPTPPTYHVRQLLALCRGHANMSVRVWASGFYVPRSPGRVRGIQGALFDATAVPDESEWARQWRLYHGLYVIFPTNVVAPHHNAVPDNEWVRLHGIVSCRSFIMSPDVYPQRVKHS